VEDFRMGLLRALVIGCALLAAGTANAERVFDLDIQFKWNASGVRGGESLLEVLTLKDDHTYVLTWRGEVLGGIWIQEKNNLQLFEESESTVAEDVAWLEQDASDFVGFPVKLTSIKFQEVAKFDRAGNLKLRSKQTSTYRPGLRANSPFKLTWSATYIGTLR
jgi:hypothetical protein